MVDSISFFVAGEPQPKGSTRSFYVKKLDRIVTTNANKGTKPWQQRIATEAQRAVAELEERGTPWPMDRKLAVELRLTFVFVIPTGYPKGFWHRDTKRPDLDKLLRAAMDGMSKILYVDDAQVIGFSCGKRYQVSPDDDPENETWLPGAQITVILKPGRVKR